jgi:hypothetical protein
LNKSRKDLSNPLVLASLELEDYANNKNNVDIEWGNIEPIEPDLVNQYLYIKSNQSKNVKPLFSLSSAYFKFLAGILSLILGLNVFIEIKKQHPHIILSTVGIIGLLVILIIF